MKNRLITILVVFIFTLFIFGCERTDVGNSSNENNSEIQSNNNSSQLKSDDISYDSSTSEISDTIESNINYIKKININSKQKLTNVGIIGDLYIYGIRESNNEDNTNITFYSYDLNTDSIIEIGTIKDINIWTTYAIMPDGLIYFTMGIMMNEDIMNKQIINNHYVMDVNEKTIKTLTSDNIYPPLVYTYAVNDFEYIEFQPETVENGYRYNISIGNTDGELKKIIVKEFDSNLIKGESISCICAYNQKIYTFENNPINDDLKKYICIYDLEGNEINKEEISYINEFLNDKTGTFFYRITAFSDYYFLTSANNFSLLLKKKDNGYEEINKIGECLIYIEKSTCIKTDQNNYLFKNLENDVYYIFNSDTEQFTILDLPYENIEQISYSENKLVVYSEEGVYFYTIN